MVEKRKNKNLSIDRYYHELSLSKNITLDEALRIQSELTKELTKAAIASNRTGDSIIFGEASVKSQMISEIVNVLFEESYGEKKELNDALQEGMSSSKDASEKLSEEFRQVVLANKQAVKKFDEIRKNGGENNSTDNKQSASISDEKQNNSERTTTVSQVIQTREKGTNNDNIMAKKQNDKPFEDNNNNSSNQNETNNVKNALIAQLKAEIAELKKNLNSNSGEKKSFLTEKEAQLVELEGKKDKGQKQDSKNNNSKESNLTSILLPIGIISAMSLVIFSAFWIVKRRKSLRRIKIRK